jgi:hypothetical protein
LANNLIKNRERLSLEKNIFKLHNFYNQVIKEKKTKKV